MKGKRQKQGMANQMSVKVVNKPSNLLECFLSRDVARVASDGFALNLRAIDSNISLCIGRE